MKLRTFFILITGSLLLMNCGGKRGEGIIGERIHVNGELPEEAESIDLFWTISSQPDASKLSMKTLEFNKDKSKISFTPDAAGKYVFEMVPECRSARGLKLKSVDPLFGTLEINEPEE